ncbi:hypothetical protein Acsp04_60320 [Actinomadura sp. NBRC 104425]|uniref:DUF6879 family protein n=1 Tax=Actinomadura sp. NBRC 104425 TaxID=3032204 RepID=UPI0024A3A3CA|nr:DUF6879 family protein [Actinomadura sp. NBRC 104425]GLZ15797.1 hypothetical protein Acsp04_60320 [Actinomadura sp. NBRC 104425]
MADLLTGDQFSAIFHTARRSAFRLETRDRYNVPSEQERIRRFLAGDPDEEYLLGAHEWGEMTRRAAAEGRPFRRVRVVTVPLGDYSRYALWSAQGNLRAGEEIRYLDRDRAAALGLPVRPPHDAWLFDDERVAVLRFDNDDRLLGAELFDDAATVEQHQRWRDIAWEASVSRAAFLKIL